MDTSKFKVGQEVYVFPGSAAFGFWKGKVVRFTERVIGFNTEPVIEVELEKPFQGNSIIRFNRHGAELGTDSASAKWDLAPEQQWRLDDMPFAERTALIT